LAFPDNFFTASNLVREFSFPEQRRGKRGNKFGVGGGGGIVCRKLFVFSHRGGTTDGAGAAKHRVREFSSQARGAANRPRAPTGAKKAQGGAGGNPAQVPAEPFPGAGGTKGRLAQEAHPGEKKAPKACAKKPTGW